MGNPSLPGILPPTLQILQTNLPATILGILIVSLTSYIFYTLWLHPLSTYPGPLLGRLTQWYDVYHAYRGDKHILLYHLHERYGPVVRYSPNTLSINSAAALRAIYSPKNTNVRKSVFYTCFRAAPQAVSTLLATDKVQHARKRRVMGQAFSDVALRGLEELVVGHVENLVAKLGEVVDRGEGSGGGGGGWSGTVDMQKYCNWLVFDIMGDLVFGRSFGTLGEKPENRKGIFLLGQAARRNYTVGAMPSLIWTRLERYLPGLRTVYRDRVKYLAFGKAQVLARTQEKTTGGESSRKDIFSFLLHARDPYSGEGFSMPELWMEGNTLIVAGSDTTSTTMAATLYFLLKNPDSLRRLEQEVRSTFRSRDEIRMGSQLQTCSFLRACIDEAMRMSPAVPGLLPREVLPGGLYVQEMDLYLPAGIDVGVCIYSIQHHADYVWEPFRYDPTRWLTAEEGVEAHPQDREALHAVFSPFSLGNRACLGKPLVYMELGIAIARLVWEFDMRLSDDQHESAAFRNEVASGFRRKEEYHTRDWFLTSNEGPWAEFRRRDSATL